MRRGSAVVSLDSLEQIVLFVGVPTTAIREAHVNRATVYVVLNTLEYHVNSGHVLITVMAGASVLMRASVYVFLVTLDLTVLLLP